jgi:hypothetical protein
VIGLEHAQIHAQSMTVPCIFAIDWLRFVQRTGCAWETADALAAGPSTTVAMISSLTGTNPRTLRRNPRWALDPVLRERTGDIARATGSSSYLAT